LTNVALIVEEADSKSQGEATRCKATPPPSLSAGDACLLLCANSISVMVNMLFEHKRCCHRHQQARQQLELGSSGTAMVTQQMKMLTHLPGTQIPKQRLIAELWM